MKKYFFSFLTLAALSSCSKTEAVYVQSDSEIKIMPATSITTKSGYLGVIDGALYPADEKFDVYAYWSSDWATDNVVDYFVTGNGGVEFFNKGRYWGGADKAYNWPKDGSLKFAAYSPSSLDIDHDYATDTYSKTAYVQPYETARTWDFLLSATTEPYTAMTAAENVSVVFEHALSWITLEVVAKDGMAAQAFEIKKVTINDVCTQADLAAAMTPGEGVPAKAWSEHSAPKDMVVFSGAQHVTMDVQNIESTPKGTIVIPQTPTQVTIEYTQKEFSGTAELEDQTIVLELILDEDGAVWEPGKHYTYTLVFGVDEILINPSVIKWDDVKIENDQAVSDQNLIYNETMLKAALASKKPHITLGDNIVLTSETTQVIADVVIDLNGFEITAERPALGKVTTAQISTIFVDGVNMTVVGTGAIKNLGHLAGYAIAIDNGGSVNIKGNVTVGSYYDAFYIKSGTLTIADGFHYATQHSTPQIDAIGCYASTVINCYDDGNSTVTLTGGTYVNMDPSNVHEWRTHNRSFVADGYTVVSEPKENGVFWFTVVRE